MLYLMLLFVVLLCIISYKTLGEDIFQPTFLVACSYIVSIICAIINENRWKYTYHLKTFVILSVGLIVFYISNLFIYCMCRKASTYGYNRELKNGSLIQIKPINVNLFVFICIVLFQFVTLALYYKEVVRIGGANLSFSEMMTSYRHQTSYGLDEERISGFVTQLSKISLVCAEISLFVFIKNCFAKELKGNIRYLIPVIIYFAQAILTGGRFNLIIILCSALLFYNVIYKKCYGEKSKIKFKTIFRILVVLIVFLIVFYNIRTWVGRTSDDDFIDYITYYLGGSIPLFDSYLQAPVVKSELWGSETFYNLLKNLKQIRLLDFPDYISHLEFRSSNGISLGNVYTAFRRQIQDFGILGMIILQMLWSGIMSFLYMRLFSKRNNDLSVVIYGNIVYTCFLHSINDCFYTTIFSIGYIERIILFCVVLYILKHIRS